MVFQANCNEVVQRLLESASRLHTECVGLQLTSKTGDTQQMDCYLRQVQLCAYEIAKDTKELVTQFSSH